MWFRNSQLSMSDNSFKRGPHAAKNKIPEDILNGKISAVDERKTVVLDEDLENVDFDDKVWLYWKRNRNFIILTVTAVLAIIVGVQGWKMYTANHASSMASGYEIAHSTNDLHNFAKSNAGTKLGALAMLESADKFYSEKKYAEAKQMYAQSAKALKSTVLFGRALLGEAMSEYMTSPDAGIGKLGDVFANASVDASFRAQAGLNLAQAQISAGKPADARKVLEEISKNPSNGIYARLAANELLRLD